VGLIQRAIENKGISTIGITIVRDYTEQVRPPRSVYLRWPFGHPLGEPDNRGQQLTVLGSAFHALYSIDQPGAIIDLPFKWRRHEYADGTQQIHEMKERLCSDKGKAGVLVC
jgi:hypothetical protein